MSNVREIIINSPKYGQKIILVDDSEYQKVIKYKWTVVSKNGIAFYAQRHFNHKTISLHRFIMGDPDSFVDHKNQNGLDNTKDNLRPCDRSQNARNSRIPKNNKSGYKGVCYMNNRYGKKWRASIFIDGRGKTIGHYHTSTDAARAYNEAAIKYHQEFASINQI